MRHTPLVLALLLACPAPAGARSESAAAPAQSSARAIYLVEFVEPPVASYRGEILASRPKAAGLKATSPAITGVRKLNAQSPDSKAYRAVLAGLRAERIAAFGSRVGRVLTPLFVYEFTSNGVALELSADEAQALARSEGVSRVEPDFTRRPMTDAGPQWIHADAIWNGTAGVTTRGEGVVVGVVDSGINRSHPSFAATGPADGFVHANPKPGFFGRCATTANAFECNAKLIGIHDFTLCTGAHDTSGCDDRETNDGSDGTGHGTHVASTAVGNVFAGSISLPSGSAPRILSGVAPHANVIAYKACESEETCRGSWLKAAIDQAVADGVDVINYSIGGGPRNLWTSSDAVAMLAAREAGIVVVVAAGNAGPDAGTVTSPGDAPWVLTAANATHDRGVVNRLLDLSGGASAPPSGGALIGVGQTGGYGPRPLVIDPQFPGCSIGTGDTTLPPTGESNPWPAGRFNGEIVVCERGVQARVAKSNNVRLAGGGGMVLVNTAAEGESTVADAHSIPATHLGFNAGQALKTWLASGSDHMGRIEGTRIENIPELADVLSASSGRGPIETAVGALKPDLTAPGSSILAAARTGNGTAFMSGTSMATPHLAGGAALLIAAKPTWNPSQVESALLTTARPSVRNQSGTLLATPLEQGSGVADLARAPRAGLAFIVTPTEFRNANPASGGTPRNLNRASLMHEACFEQCALSRRVSDLAGGASWRVEFDLPSPASGTATPAQFTLAPGASQDIAFNFDVSGASFPGSWVHGRVKFIRTGGASAENAEIPLSLFADPGSLPDALILSGSGESGYQDVPLSGLVSLPAARFATTPLATPIVDVPTLVQDPTRDDRYDGFGPAAGNVVRLVRIPRNTQGGSTQFRLSAITRSATAYDVDLFVGEDANGDGAPDEDEELCASTSARSDERCEIDLTVSAADRVYWVLAQNWDAGAQGESDPVGTSDVVTLESTAVSFDFAPSQLVATGPGRTESRAPFKLRLAWDDPTLLPGQRRLGFLRMDTSAENSQGIGLVPIEIRRNAPGAAAAALLTPGATRSMRLAAGTAQDRLYLDLPGNVSRLAVTSAGTGEVDLYVARDATASTPQIDAAPTRGEAIGTSIHPGAAEEVVLTGSALSQGRWYITPVNAGTTEAEFDLSVAVEYGSARREPKFGVYFNPARPGTGVVLVPAGPVWALAWYNYLQDGTPSWYLGVAEPPTAQQGVWRVELDRYSWDGDSAQATRVGAAQLAFSATDRFEFNWSLDGESGSESLAWIDGGGCASLNGMPAALNGIWQAPSLPGFGYAINAFPSLESHGVYFYDAQGMARWVLSEAVPFGTETLRLDQRDGFCPLCAWRDPVLRDIGSMSRRFDSDSAGQIAVDLTLLPPLSGNWEVDLPVARLSDAVSCDVP